MLPRVMVPAMTPLPPTSTVSTTPKPVTPVASGTSSALIVANRSVFVL